MPPPATDRDVVVPRSMIRTIHFIRGMGGLCGRRGHEALMPSERFLHAEIDALRALLAEADVEAQVRLRPLVDQQTESGAAAGREAVEQVLAVQAVVTVVVLRNATMPSSPFRVSVPRYSISP